MTPDQQPTIVLGFEDGTEVPRGFTFAGGRCGIKPARPDLGFIHADPPAVAAGCLTQNQMRAACCNRNEALLPSSTIGGVIVNSGNANAMTGPEGDAANEKMAELLAGVLKLQSKDVLTASTGSIGHHLPIELIDESIESLASTKSEDPRPFAEAILTTDSSTKIAHTELTLPGANTPIRVLGMAKGAGMIHPNMATTLGFVVTDAKIAPALLDELTKRAVDDTFNMISVDGDTSTNDTVLVLAGGASGVEVADDAGKALFLGALRGVLQAMARMVAGDGEGSTRLFEVEVTGASEERIAKGVARAVAKSNLVKCSVFAGRPEWGRVAMAAGQAGAELGAKLDPAKIRIGAEGTVLYEKQSPVSGVKASDLRRALKKDEIRWSIDLGQGQASAIAYGCDLSFDYVRLNAEEGKGVDPNRAGGAVKRITALSAYSPKLKQQLLVEGLAYVRRFTGLRAMVYLHPSVEAREEAAASLASDLELCLDAGLKPLALVPDEASAAAIEQHMRKSGHFAAKVPPDPVTITNHLDRGYLCLLVKETSDPEGVVELSLKLGIQKLIAVSTDEGIRDSEGYLQRMSPDTLLAGLERGRFDSSDPDVLVLARHAANQGVPALHIVDAHVPHAVVGELFTDEGIGTLITRQAPA